MRVAIPRPSKVSVADVVPCIFQCHNLHGLPDLAQLAILASGKAHRGKGTTGLMTTLEPLKVLRSPALPTQTRRVVSNDATDQPPSAARFRQPVAPCHDHPDGLGFCRNPASICKPEISLIRNLSVSAKTPRRFPAANPTCRCCGRLRTARLSAVLKSLSWHGPHRRGPCKQLACRSSAPRPCIAKQLLSQQN